MQFGLCALLLRFVGKTRAELRLRSTIPPPEQSLSFQAPQTPENREVFLLAGTHIAHDLVWVSALPPLTFAVVHSQPCRCPHLCEGISAQLHTLGGCAALSVLLCPLWTPQSLRVVPSPGEAAGSARVLSLHLDAI